MRLGAARQWTLLASLCALLVVGACGRPDQNRVEMSVEEIAGSAESGPAVVLKEKGGKRELSIFVGLPEAQAIARELRGETPPRPLTHDLLRSVIEAMGGKVKYVLVDDLRDNTYYAKIVLANGRETAVDSRPSDALALALRARAPIYVSQSVLARAAQTSGRPTV